MRTVAALIFLSVLAPCASPARAQVPGSYTACEPIAQASIVQVSGASCDDARRVATALVASGPDTALNVLRAAGWSPLRAQATDDNLEHDLVALRGVSTLRIRRPGSGPDLDGWAAGRELVFARGELVGGRPVPRGAALCTSAFLVRLPAGNLGGLSASHCGGTRKDGSVHRRNVALRRAPQPGIVLGRVRRNLEPHEAPRRARAADPVGPQPADLGGHRPGGVAAAVARRGHGPVDERTQGLLQRAHERRRSVRRDRRQQVPARRAAAEHLRRPARALYDDQCPRGR